MSDPKDPSFWDQLLNAAAASAAWMGGESGRVLVASGLGGFARWLGDERKRIWTGIIATLGGALVGYYCWPLTLHLPALVGRDPFDRTPETIAMAGFLTGTLGISLIKIFVAVIEARADHLKGAKDADQP